MMSKWKKCGSKWSILLLFVFLWSPVNAKPPEKRKILDRIENSALFGSLSKFVVTEYSKGLLDVEDYNLITGSGKSNIMNEHHVGAIGVILYEFATGSGPSTRYFAENEVFTQSVMKSPGVKWVVQQYAQQYSDSLVSFDQMKDLLDMRYQFSPLLKPLRIKTWGFGINEHIKTLRAKNLSQILLGSFNCDIQYIDDSRIRVHLWNKTSKKSLFGGFGNRLQRPLLLGTVAQHVVFDLTLEEVLELI